jgi:2-(1,2-epoxy-1,2-dihydrophenyl)acetyl-CoA isomerase
MQISGLSPVDHQVTLAGAVATVTLDRPHAYNALTGAMLASLLVTMRALDRDAAVGAIVLTGAGKGFCSGQALDDADSIPPGRTWSIGTVVLERYNPLIVAMLNGAKPILAAINGVVTGAGLGLALACDLRIASTDAVFSTGFAKIGLAVDAGVSLLLPRTIGYGRALEMALLGERCDAATATSIGLVSRVVPRDALLDVAGEVAAGLAAGPASLGGIKREFVRNGLGDVVAALEREAMVQNVAGRSDDAREGITAFREKRAPTFTRR